VAREAGLRFTAAYIDTEQDKDVVKAHIAGGRVRPLRRGTALTDAEVDAATHIVAQIGAEPYLQALDRGADVIVGGRTSDPALFAAVPLREGVAPAVAWHMAKVLDHGHFNIEPTPGVSTWVTGTAGADGFEIAASAPGGRCSALRVARTLLHESPHATRFFEPAGRLDTDRCVYAQPSDRAVRVTGSRFTPLAPTLKLEGAKPAGYRSIAVCGFRSPEVVSRLAEGLGSVEQAAEAHARSQGIAAHDYRLTFHPYGAGEVLRGRPVPAPTEVGVLAECVGVSQEVAAAVMARVSHELHVLGRAYGLAGGPAAFPFSPIDLDAGPVHRFNVWHLMAVDDPLACCRIDYERY
jgi:Acyclic terpene utilisation family protein AtuA